MSGADPVNPSTAQARLLVDELCAQGATEAVLCPGSRNAPLSFALHRADSAGRLRLHVRIDERGAGFLALGLALGSGRPVPVVCTSGTAAANLHPAVLEAGYAGVPLLVLTADRPPELVGTGASQTIRQSGLYGPAPRLAADLAVAGRPGGDPAAWRAAVRAAVAASLGRSGPGGPGPVHLNIPFAAPLVPTPESSRSAAGCVPGRPAGDGPGGDRPGDEVTLPLAPDRPTVVIGGSVPVGAPELLVPDGVPVIAEPSSPLWPGALRAGPWLLGEGGPPRPAQVMLHGRPTLHRAVTRLIADPAVEVYAVAGTGVAGWPSTVRAVGNPPVLVPPAGWCRPWATADAAAATVLEAALEAGLGAEPPAGLGTAAPLVAALPDGAVLTVGSSNPVRDVALAARPRDGVTVLANRGVAGIDGTVSTAIGATLAHQARGGGPGFALLGDLTFLHDVTGLVLGPDEPRPDLTVVVLNDAGGGIFSLLEQGAPEHADGFERVFGTPHRVRLADVCAGTGIPHRTVAHPDEVAAALVGGPGIRVLEVPARRGGLRKRHAALRARIEQAVRHALDATG